MSTAEIVHVWGRADSTALIFRHVGGDNWAVDVPPDMSDGQYACEIHAENNYGERTMWTGILYMHTGRACLHIAGTRLQLWALPGKIGLQLLPERYLQVAASRLAAEAIPDRFTILYKEDCCYGRANI